MIYCSYSLLLLFSWKYGAEYGWFRKFDDGYQDYTYKDTNSRFEGSNFGVRAVRASWQSSSAIIFLKEGYSGGTCPLPSTYATNQLAHLNCGLMRKKCAT